MNEFWEWFRVNEKLLSDYEENPQVLAELDRRVQKLGPELSWEVGPGLLKRCQFVLSPNLNKELLPVTRALISEAPNLDQWEFYAARQPKEWNYRLEMEREDKSELSLDASQWCFVLLRYPDGTREVLLKGNNLPNLTDDERWQAGAIVLESALGEEPFMELVDVFELMSEFEPRFASKERPIQDLRASITRSEDG